MNDDISQQAQDHRISIMGHRFEMGKVTILTRHRIYLPSFRKSSIGRGGPAVMPWPSCFDQMFLARNAGRYPMTKAPARHRCLILDMATQPLLLATFTTCIPLPADAMVTKSATTRTPPLPPSPRWVPWAIMW